MVRSARARADRRSGFEKGDKVSILANTRPEWTYYDFAALSAGATVVPIYQTNSPEECQYVLENSDAKAVIVEDAEQLDKIRQVRDRCPKLEHVILMTGSSDDAISADELRARRLALDAAEWEERWRSVTPGRHLHVHLHVGHHRAAEGLRDLARQLPRDDRHGARAERAGAGARHLPLPAAGPLVRAPDPAAQLRGRRRARLLGARSAEDPPQPRRGQAALLPLGAADLREDLHRGHLEGREGGRRPEARSSIGRSASAAGFASSSARARARGPRFASSTRSPTGWCCRTSATCSAGGSSRRSPAPPRSTRRSCASSTRPASSWSRAGG